MQMIEEFNIKSASGHALILQKLGAGKSYLDQGMTHLPRDFQGYRVKYSDRTAQPLDDGTFKVSESQETYRRV